MRRLLIDTDCGTDDACAILLAVRVAQKDPNLRIEAITTCHGNIELAKVRPNVLRVLKLADATDIPVFEGAERPLVEPYRERRGHLHGSDGFGGMSNFYPAAEAEIPEEHGVNAMIRLSRKFKNELSVVALGPLTNVALAQKLDPKFLSNLKELIVLGGNYSEQRRNQAPGFNFTCDPEALAIVVNENVDMMKLKIVTMEACRNHPLEWKWFDSLDESNKYIHFFKRVIKNSAGHWRALGHPGICIYDMTAMAIFLNFRIVAAFDTPRIRVELRDEHSRGAIRSEASAVHPGRLWPKAAICSLLDTDLLIETCSRFF